MAAQSAQKAKDAHLLGRWGETRVADWLRARGFQLLASEYRCRFGEIDLIVSDERYICFVEVKLRRSADFALAREFVDRHKQERLRLTAEHYLSEHPSTLQPRFDVAEVYAPEGISTKNPRINYLENAF
ncbi:MAG: YraN family protein [Oscillospiraceae bacterium]